MLKGFKQFILRGNVVDLAVGLAVGAAFGNVVSALVKDLITPIIGIFIKSSSGFASLSFSVNGSRFLYGDFLNALLSFLIIATVIYFFVVTPMNVLVARMRKEPSPDPSTKKCPQCLSEIPKEAKRCAHCTQALV